MKLALIRFAFCVLPIALSRTVPAVAAEGVPPAPATASDDNIRARELYRQGSASFKAGKDAEARQAFLEAWNIRQTYDVATALGQVEMELRLYRDAAEHLDFAIRHFAPIESEHTLEQAKQAFQDVKGRVGSVTIVVDQNGAEVRIDDRLAGISPLASPQFVDLGPHAIQVKLGGNVVSRQIVADAGKEQTVELTLGGAKSSITDDGRAAPASVGDSGKSIVPVIVGGAVFLVGVGMGIGFHVAASSDADRASDIRAGLPPGSCTGAPSAPPDCAALQDAAKSRDTNTTLSTVGIVMASVALVATPAYWFLWPTSQNSKAASRGKAVRVAGGVDGHGGRLWVSGEF